MELVAKWGSLIDLITTSGSEHGPRLKMCYLDHALRSKSNKLYSSYDLP